MKVDIPDSIIINRDDDGVLHHSYWTTDQQLVPFEATKFVRKDALLEWAEHMNEIYPACTFQMMIDKLNSL